MRRQLLVLVTAVLTFLASAASGPAPPVSDIDPVLDAIDRTGETDVTGPLNAYLRSVPNGSTVDFPAGGRYRIEGTLLVGRKRGVTLDGHGSKFFATQDTKNGSRAQWLLQNNRELTVRNMSVRGSSTKTGPSPKRGGTGVFNPKLQHQHGFFIVSSSNVLVTNVDVRGTWGDLVYVGRLQGAHKLSSEVAITDSTLVGASRQGIAVTNADQVLIANNKIDSVQFQLIDLEVHSPTDTISHVTISDNAFGASGGWSVSIGGGSAADVHDIVIDSNRVLDRGAIHGLDRYPFRVTVRPNPKRRWYNYRVTNNIGALHGVHKPLFQFASVDNVTVSGNIAPVPASPAWPRRSNVPFNEDHQPQAPITATCMSGVEFRNNTFTPKPPGMPDSVVYPCP